MENKPAKIKSLRELLGGGDLRSIGNSEKLVQLIQDQAGFDKLFTFMYDADRLIVMRAADALEKLSAAKLAYILPHKNALIKLMISAKDKDLKWHLAQLISYVKLTKKEAETVWKILEKQVRDKKESRIVRATSITSLFRISKQFSSYKNDFEKLVDDVYVENIPSLNARIRQFKM